MSIEDFKSRVQLWRDMLFLGGAISGFVALFFTVLFYGIMSLWGHAIRSEAQDWLGITDLNSAVSILAGMDKVLLEPEGLSYVREPVYEGDPLILVLYVGRTIRGTECRLEEWVSIFTDDFGRTYSGESRRPSQQLGTQVVRRELELEVPEDIPAGRATVSLQFEYHCGEETIFEHTQPVAFTLEEKNG